MGLEKKTSIMEMFIRGTLSMGNRRVKDFIYGMMKYITKVSLEMV
jgi:hypothetical protein